MRDLFPAATHVEFAIREAEDINAAYDALIDAQCSYYLVHIRREALGKLRRLLGDEDFAAGRMPLPIPMWEVVR